MVWTADSYVIRAQVQLAILRTVQSQWIFHTRQGRRLGRYVCTYRIVSYFISFISLLLYSVYPYRYIYYIYITTSIHGYPSSQACHHTTHHSLSNHSAGTTDNNVYPSKMPGLEPTKPTLLLLLLPHICPPHISWRAITCTVSYDVHICTTQAHYSLAICSICSLLLLLAPSFPPPSHQQLDIPNLSPIFSTAKHCHHNPNVPGSGSARASPRIATAASSRVCKILFRRTHTCMREEVIYSRLPVPRARRQRCVRGAGP